MKIENFDRASDITHDLRDLARALSHLEDAVDKSSIGKKTIVVYFEHHQHEITGKLFKPVADFIRKDLLTKIAALTAELETL